ncbi:uncharacterized protein UDID_17725 [Ustilago sp. UG-2017a]|nr:uncharacterized protein UDID_17725 [Ustilago sp. UG-2017a]
MLQLIKSLKLSAMPPLTRARQTGRDDDQAAAATGNGREEGWLTQVVRILQLVNPALMAEEAIVWAMGLVSISGQTPRREKEKTPKDVSSSIAHIKKLSDSNWHTWEPTFINCLQRVHNAKEILYSIIAPGSEEYDEDLDKALVGLIHACCDNSLDSRIDTYTVRGADEEVQLGSMLYAKLKKALTLNDAVKRAGCHGPECSRSRRVTGSYGRSTGIGELVDTSREHGHSAVSKETMDSYEFTCKGGPGPYARRARHSHEEDQAQGAGTAMKRTKLKEHADGYHSGARETRAKGTITGQRRRSSV